MKKTVYYLNISLLILITMLSCKKEEKTKDKFMGTYSGNLHRTINYHDPNTTNSETTNSAQIEITDVSEYLDASININGILTKSIFATVSGNSIDMPYNDTGTGRDWGTGSLSGSTLTINYRYDIVSCLSSTGYSEITYEFTGTKQ